MFASPSLTRFRRSISPPLRNGNFIMIHCRRRTHPRPLKSAAIFTRNILVMACCAFNFALTPFFECLLEAGCTDPNSLSSFTGIYSRSLCVTCFVSYAVVWCKRGTALAAYRERLAAHDVRWPAAAAERRHHAAVRCAVTAACLALTVPVNSARLYILYTSGTVERSLLMVFFAVMYAINISVCMLETRFVGLCYAVYLKFVAVNRDLDDIEGGIVEVGCLSCRNGSDVVRQRRVWVARDEDVYYCSRSSGLGGYSAGRPLVEAVEELRVRHRLVREAMAELNDAYAVPVGMTLCTLCIMTLFDMYYHMTSLETSSKTSVFIYTWLLQYGFRFFVIVKTAHATSKQALKSKEIVTNISRIFLDVNTKDELHVFSNQISSTTMEFTVYGLFTLNSHLITSALGASLTWLVFLLQSRTNTDSLY